MRRILTLAEVSENTRIPASTLRWLRHRGEGPPLWKLGGRLVAYEDELVDWLDEQRQLSSAAGSR